MPDDDERFMRLALQEAEEALATEDIPVGCLVVREGQIIGRAHNMREAWADPTAHAELIALRQAGAAVGCWRLEGAIVYCTVEPCCMCAGALVNARVTRLVYGVADPKTGACGSVLDIPREPRLNHRLEVRGGVLAAEALDLLRRFFQVHRER